MENNLSCCHTKCCSNNSNMYDLIIIGGGSAAFSAAIAASEQGKKILLINDGLPIGGTCVNVGCVPSKFLLRAAESVYRASHSPFQGIKTHAPEVDFKTLITQKKALVQTMRKKKYSDVADSIPGLTVLQGRAVFQDEYTVVVNNELYKADAFVIATGSTTNIPNIEGLEETGYLTNSTLFDMEEKPKSLTIFGAGYVGLEIATAYNRLGVKIRVIEFTDRVLRSQDSDISDTLQKSLTAEGITFYPNFRAKKVERKNGVIHIYGKNTQTGENFEITEPGHILIAAGTRPNTTNMGLERIGITLSEKGHVIVNEYMQTSVSHIFAAGDCANTPAFVYTAAKEGKAAANNAFNSRKIKLDYKTLPWVVFTSPQVAGAGMDEKQAEENRIDYQVRKLPLSEVPAAIVAQETKGFIKLVINRETQKIIGGRVVAEGAGELSVIISMAVAAGMTVEQLSEMFFPYLTLSEGIKLAALTFNKSIDKLSCCAS